MKPNKKSISKPVSPTAIPSAISLPAAKPAPVASQPAKAAVEPVKAPAAPAPKPAPTAIPAAKPARKPVTVVKAKVNVGFGNTVYIRGQGCGLSWDKGVPLVCLDASSWVWSTDKANEKIAFKLLINDQVWAQGTDLVAAPGEQVEAAPVF